MTVYFTLFHAISTRYIILSHHCLSSSCVLCNQCCQCVSGFVHSWFPPSVFSNNCLTECVPTWYSHNKTFRNIQSVKCYNTKSFINITFDLCWLQNTFILHLALSRTFFISLLSHNLAPTIHAVYLIFRSLQLHNWNIFPSWRMRTDTIF